MRLDGINAGAPTAREANLAPGSTLRLLGEAFPDLQIGEVLTATVAEARGGAALLDLKGTQVRADGLPRLPPGTDISLRVTGLKPGPVLEVVSGTRPTPSSAPLPLALGEEVAARVLQLLPDGRLLVDVKGVPLDAAAPPGIAAGTDLSLQVVRLQPEVVFQILDTAPSPEAQATQIIRANLADAVPVGDALRLVSQALTGSRPDEVLPASVTRLQETLARLLPEATPPTAERLTALVRDGGLLLEAKLAQAVRDGGPALARAADRDVKGLVLQALRDVGAAPATPRGEGLAAALTRQLGNIETQQALNLLAKLHGEPLQLQVPFYAGKDLTTAFLSVEPDGGGRGGKRGAGRRGHNVLFLLDLDGLGRTRVDAHVAPRSVRVLFYLEGAESLRKVRAEIPAFRQALEALGYDEVLLAARPLADMAPEKRQKVDALPLSVPKDTRLVDVRA